MLKASYLVTLLGVLFVVGGCPGGDDDDNDAADDACPPGETQTCTCAGGESGGQVCAADGQSWGDCDCDTGGDDDDTTGDDRVCEGDYTIEDSADIEYLDANCEVVTGSVEVASQDWLTSFHLPGLTTVQQRLTFSSNNALTSIDLSSLSSVDENLYLHNNNALTSIDLSSLSSVGGRVSFCGESLASFDLPALTTVGDGLDLTGSNFLTDLHMPVLASVGSLSICQNTALSSLDGLSNLTTVADDLLITFNDCLSQDEAEAFKAGLSVGGESLVSYNGDNYPCN